MDLVQKDFTAVSFYGYLGEHKLMGSRCRCGDEVFLPPRSYCPHCGNNKMEWMEFSGKGKLLTYTIIYIGTGAMLAAGFDRKNPYCVGIVELEEGPRISAMISGVNPFKPVEIEIGCPVTAEFVEQGPEGAKKPVLTFRVG